MKKQNNLKRNFNIVLLFVLLMSMSCGTDKESNQGLILSVELPSHLLDKDKNHLLSQIEFYRFQFKGSFPEKDPIYIERKKFKQYTFSNIPFDERLYVRVDAVSLNQQTTYCTGEATVSYHKSNHERIVIPLRCI